MPAFGSIELFVGCCTAIVTRYFRIDVRVDEFAGSRIPDAGSHVEPRNFGSLHQNLHQIPTAPLKNSFDASLNDHVHGSLCEAFLGLTSCRMKRAESQHDDNPRGET